MQSALIGVFPVQPTVAERETCGRFARDIGGLDDDSFDELDQWDSYLDTFREKVQREHGI